MSTNISIHQHRGVDIVISKSPNGKWLMTWIYPGEDEAVQVYRNDETKDGALSYARVRINSWLANGMDKKVSTADSNDIIWCSGGDWWSGIEIENGVVPSDARPYTLIDDELRNAGIAVLAWIDEIYPPDIFDGSSGDEGPVRIVAIRENLRQALQRPEADAWEVVPDGVYAKGQLSIDQDGTEISVFVDEDCGYVGVELPSGWRLMRPRAGDAHP